MGSNVPRCSPMVPPQKIMSSTYDTRAARLAVRRRRPFLSTPVLRTNAPQDHSAIALHDNHVSVLMRLPPFLRIIFLLVFGQAVNKYLPRSGLADFYPGAAEASCLCPGTRRVVMERIKAARQKLVARWAQTSTDARLATAVDTLTTELAATAAAQQFLAMYDASVVARAATKADVATSAKADAAAAAGPGTVVSGSAAAGNKAEAKESTAVTDRSSSSSDMVPILSGSASAAATASDTEAEPQSTASPAKRAGTAASSPRRKRARSSASPPRQATQLSSQSEPSVSLLQRAPDTDDTADTDTAAAAADDGNSASARPSSPSVASSGGGSTAGGSKTPRKSPRRATRAGNAMSPVKVSVVSFSCFCSGSLLSPSPPPCPV